jgi:hypothetical protein
VTLQKYVDIIDYRAITCMTWIWSQPLRAALVTTPMYIDTMWCHIRVMGPRGQCTLLPSEITGLNIQNTLTAPDSSDLALSILLYFFSICGFPCSDVHLCKMFYFAKRQEISFTFPMQPVR